MRLILAEYIRTLKERNELDRVLPDLLLSMGIVPTAKVQTGTRQFGVDLSAVGLDPSDGIEKLFLFVIKQGDLGRRDWDGGIQSIRPSMTEIFETYIASHIPKAQLGLPIAIVLATSGEMKEELKTNWAGFTRNESRASFQLWDCSKLASLIEQFLLNENVFPTDDKKHLRRALALVGELDYKPEHLFKLLRTQLSLNDISNKDSKNKVNDLAKALVLANLSTNIFISWAVEENNTKPALLAAERLLLWVEHRMRLLKRRSQIDYSGLNREFDLIQTTYFKAAHRYFEKIQPYCALEDGLVDHLSNSTAVSLVVFEQIGILASFGLSNLDTTSQTRLVELGKPNLAKEIADTLVLLIRNHQSAGSPFLDDQVTDINLALLFLTKMGRFKEVREWLDQLVHRVVIAYKLKRHFPANRLDELVNASYEYSTMSDKGFNYTSWLLPTLADWCVLFGKKDLYALLAAGMNSAFPRVCLQLWHPTKNVEQILFQEQAIHKNGNSEVSIELPASIQEYLTRINKIRKAKELDILAEVSAPLNAQFIAFRHFRTLVPPFLLYTEFAKVWDIVDLENDYSALVQHDRITENLIPLASFIWLNGPPLKLD